MLETFVNSKAKTSTIFLFSMASLGILAVSTQIGILIFSEWYGLIAGIVLMFAAIPLHRHGKNAPIFYIYSFAANSIGSGFSLSAYYICKKIPVHLTELLLDVLPAAGILLLSYAVIQIFIKTKKFAVLVALLICVLLMIVDVIFWIKTGNSFYSFGFFSLLLCSFYLCVFGLSVGHKERSVLRDISFGSFGAFAILTVVVIFILTEGSILDGADFSGDGKKKTVKKK